MNPNQPIVIDPQWPNPSQHTRAFAVALLAIALAALCWRWVAISQSGAYSMIDETIPLAVLQSMRESGTLNTNWAHTDVYPDFRYNQFNFSAYHIVAALLSAPIATTPAEQNTLLPYLRLLSTVFGVISVVLAGWLGRRVAGNTAGLVAAAMTGIAVSLFQDSMYARPDTFTTMLTLCLALLATSRSAARLPMVLLTGGVLGLLIATKITFIAMLPFVLMAMQSQVRDHTAHTKAGAFFAGIAIGFTIGAPYALRQPGQFLHGVTQLFNQYGGQHGPHGVGGGDLLQRLAYSFNYLLQMVGPGFLVLAAIGLAVLARRASTPFRLVLLGITLTWLYFMQSNVFFERNLSHALPFLFIACGTTIAWLLGRVRRPPIAIAAAVGLGLVVALPAARPTYLLVHHALPGTQHKRLLDIEQALGQEGYLIVDAILYDKPLEIQAGDYPCTALVLRVTDYGDRHTAQTLQHALQRSDFALVARVPGVFQGMPTSTLHTYHETDVVYVRRVATPADQAGCPLLFGALPTAAAVQSPATQVALSGDAKAHAHHPSARGPSWLTATWATWNGNDANVGEIVVEARWCEGDVLPLVMGPGRSQLSLVVDFMEEEEAPPIIWDTDHMLPNLQGWFGVRLPKAQGPSPASSCSPVRIQATDAGQQWGSWLGVGAPARLPALKSP